MANNVNIFSICCGFEEKIGVIKKHLEELQYYKLEIDKHLELIKNYIVKLKLKKGLWMKKIVQMIKKVIVTLNCQKVSLDTKEKIGELHGHSNSVTCVKFSPYHRFEDRRTVICSTSLDKTICFWDIQGHEYPILSVKYVSPELVLSNGTNIILSGSIDQSVRLWDVRSAKQINVFDDHTNIVTYNIVRFWDVRLNKQLDILKGNKGDAGLFCIKYLLLKKGNSTNQNINVNYLCYGARVLFNLRSTYKKILLKF
ncbi:hypothetical protein RFI_24815 [Reticulomyxa filosa]|uniref:Uncharacterized protein n=1 Tax=Reticulomyxa filosa TaxID=46433 RepID=X6MHL3_RETFI|nr:hypothetical protein RFI_24815 [Reticulomyxa filosa]|eukprot:ETO12560.1 hypothetical protein RFI_24815 [Reticulomyxa filosa]